MQKWKGTMQGKETQWSHQLPSSFQSQSGQPCTSLKPKEGIQQSSPEDLTDLREGPRWNGKKQVQENKGIPV